MPLDALFQAFYEAAVKFDIRAARGANVARRWVWYLYDETALGFVDERSLEDDPVLGAEMEAMGACLASASREWENLRVTAWAPVPARRMDRLLSTDRWPTSMTVRDLARAGYLVPRKR